MNEKVKKKWLKALRNGKYKQGKRYLRTGETYCCLGVLCDLHAKETCRTWAKDAFGYSYMGAASVLPQIVTTWAGLHEYNPTVSGTNYTLATVNDYKGYDFEAIAKIIEAQL